MAVLRAARLWLAELPPGSELPPPSADGEEQLELPPPLAVDLSVFTCPPGKKAIVRTMTNVWTGSIPIASQSGMFVHVVRQEGGYGIAVHRYWAPFGYESLYGATLTNIWQGTLVLNQGDQVVVTNTAYLVLATHGSGMLVDA